MTMQIKQFIFTCLILATIFDWRGYSWAHDVGEPALEKLPIWNKCCGGGDCLSRTVRIRGEGSNKKIIVDIDGVQTAVDKDKFSPVPGDRTWVCYVNPNGDTSNENIRCVLYPQSSGTN